MLKIIFFTISIIGRVSSWFGLQVTMFIGAFLLRFCGLSEFFFSDLGLIFGIDFVGYILILLSFWIIGLVCSASQKIFDLKNFPRSFLLVRVFLILRLVLTFSSVDYLTFYIFFERSLIPTIILILG